MYPGAELVVDILSVDAKRQRIELALSSGAHESSTLSSSNSNNRPNKDTKSMKRVRSEGADGTRAPEAKIRKK